MVLALVLSSLVAAQGTAAAPVQNTSTVATAPEPAATRHAIVIDGATADSAALHDELNLRLAERVVAIAGPDVALPPAPVIWIFVRNEGQRVEVQLIVSDGRLYRRRVDADPEQRARVVAGTIANMVDGIENNRLAPQQTGVQLPESPAEPEPKPVLEPEPKPKPKPKPKPNPQPPPGQPRVPPSWLGVAAHGALSFGVGAPRDVAGPTGAGGGVGLRLTHTSGAIVGLQARAAAWRNFGVGITRVRLSPVAGYAWRVRRLELSAAAGPTLEFPSLTVRVSTPTGTPRASLPLLGGRLVVRPAWLLTQRNRWAALLGISAEFSGAVEARRPAGAVQIFRPTPAGPQPILRAGGLELSAAATVEFRFALDDPAASR